MGSLKVLNLLGMLSGKIIRPGEWGEAKIWSTGDGWGTKQYLHYNK